MAHFRILVVDDYEAWRKRIRAILEPWPELDVIGEASDGLEALQKAEELRPDIILLDIGIPRLNGIETGHRLSQLVPTAKVLFVTQENDPEVIKATFSSGTCGYVIKTDAGSELVPAIQAVLRGDRFIRSRIAGLTLRTGGFSAQREHRSSQGGVLFG